MISMRQRDACGHVYDSTKEWETAITPHVGQADCPVTEGCRYAEHHLGACSPVDPYLRRHETAVA